jgi:hypothetical protein
MYSKLGEAKYENTFIGNLKEREHLGGVVADWR